ncbi:MAG TPA: ABC transporter permease [Thermomicrobiales bacterium]|nr:peptide ABC transporter permease [Chloroflexota bacterium]HCG29119.1 peptide ABC transporter permease [Chloroflexota bacterium]HQZ89857.1 ABC transporter permease [Thermomicrobiales bacterium]HRA30885.1 ABC transporter permease [Thermomicrobiales bacterium]
MVGFIIRRVLAAIPVLWIVISVTFVLMHLAPGGPWDAMKGKKRLDPALQAAFNHKYGLDKPLYEQYLLYLRDVVRLDFGTSFAQQGSSTFSIIARGFPYSASVGLGAFFFAVIVGIPLGILASTKQNTWVDYISLIGATASYAIPNFVIGVFMLVIFGVKLGWVSILWKGQWSNYVLPSIVLGLGSAAFLARLTRAAMLEELHHEYVRTARAKGLSTRVVIARHVVRNALIPVVTIMGPTIAALVTGTIIIEQIFNVPGMGRLYITSITSRDYPVIMGVTLLYAFFIILGNMLVDITYGLIDPRVKNR